MQESGPGNHGGRCQRAQAGNHTDEQGKQQNEEVCHER